MVLGLVAAPAADLPSFAAASSSLFAVLGLVALNGFFVAAEFSLVATRRSKLDEMIAKGDRGAKAVQVALQHLDRIIAGTQLGITIASLAWVDLRADNRRDSRWNFRKSGSSFRRPPSRRRSPVASYS